MKKAYRASIIRLFWVALVLGTAMLVISAVDSTNDSRTTGVNIQIEPILDGKYLINEEDVKNIIQAAFDTDLIGLKLSEIDVERLEIELEDEPFVLDAETYINAREEINIQLTQRVPILRVIDKNGLDYYLDELGVKMNPSKHYTARVVVVTGDLPAYTDDYLQRENHIISDLFKLVNFIRADDLLQPFVEQIHVKKKEFTLIPKIGDQKILMGHFSDIEDKVERLKIFYKEGMSRTGWQRYKELDLRYKGQVIGRK